MSADLTDIRNVTSITVHSVQLLDLCIAYTVLKCFFLNKRILQLMNVRKNYICYLQDLIDFKLFCCWIKCNLPKLNLDIHPCHII